MSLRHTLPVLVLAGTLGVPVAQAHTDVDEYATIQWHCTDIPYLLHKQSTHNQRFVISNVGPTDLFWWFVALDSQGTLMTRLAESMDKGWGTLEAYRTASVTNTELQSADAPTNTPHEPIALCLRNDKDRGAFAGYVKVRELRRVQATSWVGFELGEWWKWWTVTTAPTASNASAARASAPKRQ